MLLIRGRVFQKIFLIKYSKSIIQRKKTGTGLGLPTAKRIIEEHKGTISVQSEENKGSNFSIKLPVDVNIY